MPATSKKVDAKQIALAAGVAVLGVGVAAYVVKSWRGKSSKPTDDDDEWGKQGALSNIQEVAHKDDADSNADAGTRAWPKPKLPPTKEEKEAAAASSSGAEEKDIDASGRLHISDLGASLILQPEWEMVDKNVQSGFAVVTFSHPEAVPQGGEEQYFPPLCLIAEDVRLHPLSVKDYASKSKATCAEMMMRMGGNFQVLQDGPMEVGPFVWQLEYTQTFSLPPPESNPTLQVMNRICMVDDIAYTLQYILKEDRYAKFLDQATKIAQTAKFSVPKRVPPGVIRVTDAQLRIGAELPEGWVSVDKSANEVAAFLLTECNSQFGISILQDTTASEGGSATVLETLDAWKSVSKQREVHIAMSESIQLPNGNKCWVVDYSKEDLRTTAPREYGQTIILPTPSKTVFICLAVTRKSSLPQAMVSEFRAAAALVTAVATDGDADGLAYVNERLGVSFQPLSQFRISENAFEQAVSMVHMDDESNRPSMCLHMYSLADEDPQTIHAIKQQLQGHLAGGTEQMKKLEDCKLGGLDATSCVTTETIATPTGPVRATAYILITVLTGKMVELKWFCKADGWEMFKDEIEFVNSSFKIF